MLMKLLVCGDKYAVSFVRATHPPSECLVIAKLSFVPDFALCCFAVRVPALLCAARNGCAACGCEDGCVPRDFQQCECSFHARADERLLNRVVRRAAATPNFMSGFK